MLQSDAMASGLDRLAVFKKAGSAAVVRPLGALASMLTRMQGNLYQAPDDIIPGMKATDWPSPLQPVRPFGTPDAQPLGFNMQMGQNLIFTPRPDSRYTAADLQALARYPLARMCITNVIDTISSLKWKIQLRAQPGEDQKVREAKQLKDDTILKLTDFVAAPDGEHDFKMWVRPLINDMLTIDAGNFLLRKSPDDTVFEWRVLQGAYITRYVDANGYTPAAPAPAFGQNWEGVSRVFMSTDQLIYRPRNIVYEVGNPWSALYGLSNTEALAEELEVGIQRLRYVKAFYKDGSIPNVLWVVPADTQPDTVTAAMNYLNSDMSGNLESRRMFRFAQGFRGADSPKEEFIKQFEEPKLSDEYDDLSTRRICFGYGVSPQRLLRMQNRACYSSDTETLTERGWRRYVEIEDGEKVAQFNPETNEIEFVAPDALFVYPYSGEMVHFTSASVDVLVTPEHAMWTRQYNGRKKKWSEFRKLRADALKRPIRFLAATGYSGEEQEEFILPAVANCQVKLSRMQTEEIYACAKERPEDIAPRYGVSPATIYRLRRNPATMFAQSDPLRIRMDDWLEFLGYFLSEGGLAIKGRNRFLSLSQKKQPGVDKIDSCLSRLPFSVCRYIGGDGAVRWNIYGKALSVWLAAHVGTYCYNKRIPRRFMGLSVRQLGIMFDALILGDGSVDPREGRTGKSYYSTSKQLADDVHELTVKLGYSTSVSCRPDRRGGKRRDMHRVLMCERKEHDLQSASHIQREQYEGDVYCFRVPTGLFVTRRNGKVAIQGNTATTNQEAAEEEGIAPSRTWVEDSINWALQRKMGYQKYEFKFDISTDPDPMKQATIDEQDLNGKMTLDEVRARAGLDAINSENSGKVGKWLATGWAAMDDGIVVPPAKPGTGNDPEPDDDPDDDGPKPGAGGNQKFAKADAQSVTLDPGRNTIRSRAAQAQLFSRIYHFFHTIKSTMVIVDPHIKSISSRMRKADEPDAEVQQQIEQIVEAIMASIPWQSVPDYIQPAIEEAAADGAAIGLDQVERAVQSGPMVVSLAPAPVRVITSSVISDVNQVAMDYAKKRGAELVGMKWVDGELVENPNAAMAITDSTRNMLREILTDAFSRETPMSELVARIQAAGVFSEERAQLIAATETKFAQACGNLEAWMRTGVVKTVGWLLSGLHDQEDECDLNHEAGNIPIGEAFPSGDVAPPAHPRCICTMALRELSDPTKKKAA